MTCLFMEGFESVIDNLDLTARGWRMSAFAGFNGQDCLTVPSKTGVAGRALTIRGPYASQSNTTLPLSGTIDSGMLDTGISINSLWNAGGFSVGFSASFNQGTVVQVAANGNFQIAYDGAQYYWAIVEVASTFNVAYSADLTSWTVCASAPANIGTDATICVIGSGSSATIVVGNEFASNTNPGYYSTNMGSSWSAITPPSGATFKMFVATGNATTPYAVITAGPNTVQTMTSITATPQPVSGLTLVSAGTYNCGLAKVVNGFACFMSLATSSQVFTPSNNSGTWWFCSTAADMTASSNYKQAQSIASHQMNDITFFNNTWITAGWGGIYTASNPGTGGTVLPPTAAWTQVLSSPSATFYSIASNSNICVAVGMDTANTNIAAIYTSKDGVTWTKANRFLFAGAGAQNSNAFMNVIWTGTQFVLTGALNSNVIATSPDGIAWTGTYYPDYAEIAGTASASPLGVFSGTILAGTYTGAAQGGAGTYAPWSTSGGYAIGIGFNASAVSSGARTVQGVMVPAGTSTSAVAAVSGASSAVSSPGTHYYEIIATKSAALTNSFTFQFAIDGALLPGVSSVFYFASNTDTTGASHLLLNLPRSGNWTAIDDIYVTNFAGAHNVGQLGTVNVVPWTTASDAQAQFTQTKSAASDAIAVQGALGNSENSVYSTTVGAKDIYKMTTAVPALYRVRAVQAEAFFSKYGASGANGTVGIVSGSTEVDSAQIVGSSSTPAFGAILSETDPNTGASWTSSGLTSAEVAINKVT